MYFQQLPNIKLFVLEDEGEVNASNALNLSESEDEGEIEDIIEDFAAHATLDTVSLLLVP